MTINVSGIKKEKIIINISHLDLNYFKKCADKRKFVKLIIIHFIFYLSLSQISHIKIL